MSNSINSPYHFGLDPRYVQLIPIEETDDNGVPHEPGEVIGPNDLVVVELLGIDIAKLYSRETTAQNPHVRLSSKPTLRKASLSMNDGDNMKNREGNCTISVKGMEGPKQSTLIPWKTGHNGKMKKGFKIPERVLYFGYPKGSLSFQAELTETMKQEADDLKHLKRALKYASQIAGFFPGAGSVVGLVTGAISTLADIAIDDLKDATELDYRGSMGHTSSTYRFPVWFNGNEIRFINRPSLELRAQTYAIVRKNSRNSDHADGAANQGQLKPPPESDTDIAIRFQVHKLTPVKNIKVALVLNHVHVIVHKNLNGSNGQELVLEGTFGAGKTQQSVSLTKQLKPVNLSQGREIDLNEVMAFDQLNVYQGSLQSGIPFNLSFMIASQGSEQALEKMENVMAEGFKVASGVISAEHKPTLETVQKATTTAREMAMEFYSEKKSAGSKSGVICSQSAQGGVEDKTAFETVLVSARDGDEFYQNPLPQVVQLAPVKLVDKEKAEVTFSFSLVRYEDPKPKPAPDGAGPSQPVPTYFT